MARDQEVTSAIQCKLILHPLEQYLSVKTTFSDPIFLYMKLVQRIDKPAVFKSSRLTSVGKSVMDRQATCC
jgi:hypothetical protein